ncbi:Velvet domain-containing protein [Mycena kentingensis (nom. inval.)]|nr:Velvet domain-containing protein [Mycena kentingensis (nom. inval.)]
MDVEMGDDQYPPQTVPDAYAQHRKRLQYELTVRQEPKQARMCGIGGKADRRPIDPPVIVQLRVIDPDQSPTSDKDDSVDDDAEPPYSNLAGYAQSFLQNPYYFMFASLAKPDDDTELHWLKDGRTRCTTGSVVSSLYALKDPTAPPTQNSKDSPTTAPPSSDAGFFVFPDLSVRTEGSYRLKLSLYEVVGNDVRHCKSIYSAAFYVYTAKKFPGVEESSPLTCSLADQGIKIRIRKDIRMRKSRVAAPSSSLGTMPTTSAGLPPVDLDQGEDEKQQGSSSHRPAKRSRTDDGSGNTGPAPPVGTAWPTTPLIPPPPGAEIQGQPAMIPPPPGATHQLQTVIPPPPPPMSAPPPPEIYDARYAAYDQSQSTNAAQSQAGAGPSVPLPLPPPQHQPAHPQMMHPPAPPPHPYAHAHAQYPYYPYHPPAPWGPAPGYADPYAHMQQPHAYGPPPVPVRYDYPHGYAPPPPAAAATLPLLRPTRAVSRLPRAGWVWDGDATGYGP